MTKLVLVWWWILTHPQPYVCTKSDADGTHTMLTAVILPRPCWHQESKRKKKQQQLSHIHLRSSAFCVNTCAAASAWAISVTVCTSSNKISHQFTMIYPFCNHHLMWLMVKPQRSTCVSLWCAGNRLYIAMTGRERWAVRCSGYPTSASPLKRWHELPGVASKQIWIEILVTGGNTNEPIGTLPIAGLPIPLWSLSYD